ncbi:ATP-binding protein [Streptomyces sp. NPDC008139]|uniref:ATP-binding protein n=1 Tax=Streptomyces sp. NPDC008139 TaxID=3364814 RepID=UPI0036E76870
MPGFPYQPLPASALPSIPPVPALWRFPAEAGSVRRARHAVAEALPGGLRSQLGHDLGLVTSELVTNALRYGARSEDEELVELVLWTADNHYWIAVSDPGAGTPALSPPGPDSCGGRGLVLVDALTAAWAVVPRSAQGKSVVAGLPIYGD